MTCSARSSWRLGILLTAITIMLLVVWVETTRAQAGAQRVVRVAAAADLKFALDEILAAFNERYPDVKPLVSYGSSGNFYAQLTNRAPFDIFFSADIEYPQWLIQQGIAAEETAFLYAIGRLVVWVPHRSPIDVEMLGMQALLEPEARKIAIANPRHAPYGRAAEAAMRALGVYEQVQDRLVLGENIAQTAQFIQVGAADIGIIALALALAPGMRQEGRHWEIPLEAYPRMDQGGIILPWAQDLPAAQDLRAFVLGPDGKAVLRKYGFFLPGE